MAVAVPTPVIVDDDDEMEFMGRLMPALALNFLMQRARNRKRATSTTGPGRGGKIGRRWRQRKKGQLKNEMFSWWKLIHKPDVGDVTSRNGKVLIYLFIV